MYVNRNNVLRSRSWLPYEPDVIAIQAEAFTAI